MGNSLESHRAAIGLFYMVTHSSVKILGCNFKIPEFNFNLRFSIYFTINILCLLSLKSFVKNDEFAFYRCVLLLICMDIELNPGPDNRDASINSLDIFHLNTRSVRNKLDYIQDVVESFHIICFSETHLDDSVPTSSLLMEGFNKKRSYI